MRRRLLLSYVLLAAAVLVGLEVPLAILFATELWSAWERHSGARYLVAGGLAGLCVLTQLELVVLVPGLLLVLGAEALSRPRTSTWGLLVACAALPLVVVSPWLAFNEVHFHAVTAGALAIREQSSVVNPHHLHYALSALPSDSISPIVASAAPRSVSSCAGVRRLVIAVSNARKCQTSSTARTSSGHIVRMPIS